MYFLCAVQYLLCTVEEPEADRDQQNRKRLFKAKVGSQVIRISEGTESQGRIVIVSRSVLTSKSRQNQKQNQRGVVYNFSIDWLPQNRRRIKINVLTG